MSISSGEHILWSDLDKKDIETEKSSEIIELLLTKGLIYEEPKGKYNIVM